MEFAEIVLGTLTVWLPVILGVLATGAVSTFAGLALNGFFKATKALPKHSFSCNLISDVDGLIQSLDDLTAQGLNAICQTHDPFARFFLRRRIEGDTQFAIKLVTAVRQALADHAEKIAEIKQRLAGPAAQSALPKGSGKPQAIEGASGSKKESGPGT